MLTGASALIAVGALLLTTLRGDSSWLALSLPLLPFGVGVGLAFGVMDNAAVSTVPVARAGAAAGIFNTMRIAGESVAVAGAAALLTSLTAAGLRDSDAGLPAGTAARLAGQAIQGQVSGSHRAALAVGYTEAFHVLGVVLAVLSTVGAVLTHLALRRGRAPGRSDHHDVGHRTAVAARHGRRVPQPEEHLRHP